MDVVERKQTKLRWKHVKLNARTKMSVKRAVDRGMFRGSGCRHMPG